MDDIIVAILEFLFRRMTASNQTPARQTARPTPLEIQRQKEEVERRIREMQNAGGATRPRNAAVAGNVRRMVKRPPQLQATPVTPVAPVQRQTRPVAQSGGPRELVQPTRPAFNPRRLIVPILLGEILDPPLSLREGEL